MTKKPKENAWLTEFNRRKNDPVVIAGRKRFTEERKLGKEQEPPIISELAEVGIHVHTVGDLITRDNDYEVAIPILVKHLLLPYSITLRSALARALAVKEARPYWDTFVELYLKQAGTQNDVVDDSYADSLACTLAACATREDLPQIISILLNANNGPSRGMLLSVLRPLRNKDLMVKEVLDQLRLDPMLAVEIDSWKPLKPRFNT